MISYGCFTFVFLSVSFTLVLLMANSYLVRGCASFARMVEATEKGTNTCVSCLSSLGDFYDLLFVEYRLNIEIGQMDGVYHG